MHFFCAGCVEVFEEEEERGFCGWAFVRGAGGVLEPLCPESFTTKRVLVRYSMCYSYCFFFGAGTSTSFSYTV